MYMVIVAVREAVGFLITKIIKSCPPVYAALLRFPCSHKAKPL